MPRHLPEFLRSFRSIFTPKLALEKPQSPLLSFGRSYLPPKSRFILPKIEPTPIQQNQKDHLRDARDGIDYTILGL